MGLDSGNVTLPRPRVLILISGTGSLADAIMTQAQSPDFPAQVIAVGADREAVGLAHAHRRGIDTFVVAPADYRDRNEWGGALRAQVQAYQPDLVVCAGFMRILPASFIEAFSPRLINSHPALLPAFPGAHGVADALAYGVKVTGATVHVVDTGVDTGPIIAQQAIAVQPDDDEASLHERIKVIEREMLVRVVAEIVGRRIEVTGRKVTVS